MCRQSFILFISFLFFFLTFYLLRYFLFRSLCFLFLFLPLRHLFLFSFVTRLTIRSCTHYIVYVFLFSHMVLSLSPSLSMQITKFLCCFLHGWNMLSRKLSFMFSMWTLIVLVRTQTMWLPSIGSRRCTDYDAMHAFIWMRNQFVSCSFAAAIRWHWEHFTDKLTAGQKWSPALAITSRFYWNISNALIHRHGICFAVNSFSCASRSVWTKQH